MVMRQGFVMSANWSDNWAENACAILFQRNASDSCPRHPVHIIAMVPTLIGPVGR
jgi:hypothetical protein